MAFPILCVWVRVCVVVRTRSCSTTPPWTWASRAHSPSSRAEVRVTPSTASTPSPLLHTHRRICVRVCGCAGELSDDAYRLKRHHPTLKPMHMATDKDDIKIEYRDDYGRVMVSFRTHTHTH